MIYLQTVHVWSMIAHRAAFQRPRHRHCATSRSSPVSKSGRPQKPPTVVDNTATSPCGSAKTAVKPSPQWARHPQQEQQAKPFRATRVKHDGVVQALSALIKGFDYNYAGRKFHGYRG